MLKDPATVDKQPFHEKQKTPRMVKYQVVQQLLDSPDSLIRYNTAPAQVRETSSGNHTVPRGESIVSDTVEPQPFQRIPDVLDRIIGELRENGGPT